MNESENKFEAGGSSSDVAELRNELQALRTSFASALVLMFVFSFCVNVFLFRQASELGVRASQAGALVNAWVPGGPAQVQAMDFWNRLVDFSKTHPDFAPIINKYSQFINARASAPSAAPAKK